jgi:hypothetical protein
MVMATVSTILLPPELIPQVDRAALIAKLNEDAATALNEAGNGLIAAFEQVKVNASNGHTMYVLVVVQGYINDAMAKMIEIQNLGIEGV